MAGGGGGAGGGASSSSASSRPPAAPGGGESCEDEEDEEDEEYEGGGGGRKRKAKAKKEDTPEKKNRKVSATISGVKKLPILAEALDALRKAEIDVERKDEKTKKTLSLLETHLDTSNPAVGQLVKYIRTQYIPKTLGHEKGIAAINEIIDALHVSTVRVRVLCACPTYCPVCYTATHFCLHHARPHFCSCGPTTRRPSSSWLLQRRSRRSAKRPMTA